MGTLRVWVSGRAMGVLQELRLLDDDLPEPEKRPKGRGYRFAFRDLGLKQARSIAEALDTAAWRLGEGDDSDRMLAQECKRVAGYVRKQIADQMDAQATHVGDMTRLYEGWVAGGHSAVVLYRPRADDFLVRRIYPNGDVTEDAMASLELAIMEAGEHLIDVAEWERDDPVTVAQVAAAWGDSSATPAIGSCATCHATIAAHYAYPSRSGYWKCRGCIGNDGYYDVSEAVAAIFEPAA